MATLRITVDGNTVMDGDLGQWTTEPPFIAEQLKANARPAPWMRCLMLTLADAAMSEKVMSVDVRTRANGWDFSVTERAVLVV
jgi:hypothetical protein